MWIQMVDLHSLVSYGNATGVIDAADVVVLGVFIDGLCTID